MRDYRLDLNVAYLDSDAGDAYVVQAADYVANAVYTYYEFNNALYHDILRSKLYKVEKFPWEFFGT